MRQLIVPNVCSFQMPIYTF